MSELKHLGNTISNKRDGNQLDIKVKAAKYIDKNNSIQQEFYFAHPESKVKLNNIYNGHWTGSQLWKLGSKELQKIEGTYNKSVKIMYDLPWARHRYLIEPLTGFPHVRRVLVGRYLSFVKMIQKSGKFSVIQLLDTILRDVRFSTGSNITTIMLMTDNNCIEDLEHGRTEVKYHEIEDSEAWRVDFLKEVVDIKYGNLLVPGFDLEELEFIQEQLCTQ